MEELLIFEAFQNDMDEQGRLLCDSNIHIENDFTVHREVCQHFQLLR